MKAEHEIKKQIITSLYQETQTEVPEMANEVDIDHLWGTAFWSEYKQELYEPWEFDDALNDWLTNGYIVIPGSQLEGRCCYVETVVKPLDNGLHVGYPRQYGGGKPLAGPDNDEILAEAKFYKAVEKMLVVTEYEEVVYESSK